MNINKAEQVEQAYDYASLTKHFSSEGCYREAVDTALKLGGIETYNKNDENRTKSPVPSMEFEFDDKSNVYITYVGVFVIG